jgi:hypothetical protein
MKSLELTLPAENGVKNTERGDIGFIHTFPKPPADRQLALGDVEAFR